MVLATVHKNESDRTLDSLMGILTPRELLTVSQWADKYRVLNEQYTSEPGRWHTSRTPYLREIMDSFRDGSVGRITFIKSSRVGGTEAMNNMLLYSMDENPAPTMYVLPTEDAASEEVSERLKDMVLDCDRVSRHISKTKWATAGGLKLTTMRLYMAWAASPVTLTRRTVRDIYFDELDNCEMQAGKLGQHAELASDRNTTYGHLATMVCVSTPSTAHAAGWRQWLDSDMRRYHVPCPLCGVYQVLKFDNIKVPEGMRDYDAIESLELAWYECEACKGKLIDAEHKTWMVARGIWIAHTQKITEPLPIDDPDVVSKSECGEWKPEIEGERPVTRRIGFHLWSGYSPWRTWSQIISKFFRVKDDPEMLQVFVNSWLGEAWSESINEIDSDTFGAKREGSLPKDVVPDYVDVLIMGADVQEDHLYYIIRGFGEGRRSHLIREGVVSDFFELYEVFMRDYERTDGKMLSPALLAIDSGYRTHEVYDFAKTHLHVFPVKGVGDVVRKVTPSPIEYVSGKRRLNRIQLYRVDTHYFKGKLYQWAGFELGEPCSFAIHADATDDYCKQFTSEHRIWVTRTRGNRKVRVLTWDTKTPNAKNHYLDCEVYAIALAQYMKVLALTKQKADPKPKPRRLPSPRLSRNPLIRQ